MRVMMAVAAVIAFTLGGCQTTGTEAAASTSPLAASCSALTPAALGASEVHGTWNAAASGLPAYCEVTAVLTPAPGSRIGVVYRLPEGWNGRLLGLGGGGWAGNVTLQAAEEGLKAGYATAQTDGGHPGTSPWDNSWAANPQAVTDFAYRAVHEMTVAGKALVAAYYGRAQDRAYFQGCSTGGRMALMEAQRFPLDYDAITAGAPVYTLQVQTSAVLRDNLFAAPGAAFTAAQLDLVSHAAIAACDRDDGLADGIIGDPRSCGWDPGELVCKAGDAPESCISEAQATALRAAYRGERSPDGQWAMFPLSKGGEPGWSFFIATDGGPIDTAKSGGLITLDKQIWGDRQIDWRHFSAATDVPEARASTFAQAYEANDPDISAFIAHGGKLILWHGESDQGPSALGTADYYEAVRRAVPAAADKVRFFALPGVPHCRGGPGADTLDLLGALDDWEASGVAPESLVATRAGAPIVRKACAWPRMARYGGSGDADDPANWSCIARPAPLG